MNYLEYSTGKIRNFGGRITKTKLAVLEVLSDLEKPINAYEIAERIEKDGGSIDVVTVYRILDSFEGLKLVHKSDKGFMPCTHYSCHDTNHCHHQFFCNKCERAFEVHIDDKNFLSSVSQKFGDLLIQSHDFRFSGLCKNCKS